MVGFNDFGLNLDPEKSGTDVLPTKVIFRTDAEKSEYMSRMAVGENTGEGPKMPWHDILAWRAIKDLVSGQCREDLGRARRERSSGEDDCRCLLTV